ncbi:MAG TPA: hypothetical protein VIL36_23305 [Acidimicrobiales bacterium]
MDSLTLLLAFLAVYRLTILVTADEITRPWRDRTTEVLLGHRLERQHDGSPAIQISDGTLGKARCRCGYERLFDPGSLEDRNTAVDLVTAHVRDQNALEAESDSLRARAAYLIGCEWCASTWIAPLVVASALAWGDGWGWQLAAGSLAASAVTGAIASYARP